MTVVAPVGSRSARVQRDARTLAFAWLVTLILSSLPAIIAVELTGVGPRAPTGRRSSPPSPCSTSLGCGGRSDPSCATWS